MIHNGRLNNIAVRNFGIVTVKFFVLQFIGRLETLGIFYKVKQVDRNMLELSFRCTSEQYYYISGRNMIPNVKSKYSNSNFSKKYKDEIDRTSRIHSQTFSDLDR